VAPHSASRKQVMRLLAKMRKMARGFQNSAHLIPTFQVRGQTVTPAQALAMLQPSLSKADLVDSTRKTLTTCLAARDSGVLGDETLLRDLTNGLQVKLGSANVELSGFGVPYAQPRRVRTQAEEAVSAALRQQTRGVRGTMGRKQRAAITAAGRPGVVVVDATGKPIKGAGLAPVAPGKKPAK
jgi:hypothetical protein